MLGVWRNLLTTFLAFHQAARIVSVLSIVGTPNASSLPCFLPRGPIFTAISYWEALTAGSVNVVNLFALAKHLNGTAVDPYVNDINSQHPFSGHLDNDNDDDELLDESRYFSTVYSMGKLVNLLGLKVVPPKPNRVKSCRHINSEVSNMRVSNVIFILYENSSTEIIRGQECAYYITYYDMVKIKAILGDPVDQYWCISSELDELPDELIASNAVNVIINWHGTTTESKSHNRVRWYASHLRPIDPPELYRAVTPNIKKQAEILVGSISHPYLTIHLRIGRNLSFKRQELIDFPNVDLAIGHLIVDCLVDHTKSILRNHGIKSVLVLDDFEQMSFGSEVTELRSELMKRIKNEFLSLNSHSTNVYYSIDLIAKKAGCDVHSLIPRNFSLWESLTQRKRECKNANKEISRDFTLIDLFLASKANYVLRVGLSLYGQMICDLGDDEKKDSCFNILHTQDGFRHETFKKAMIKDCYHQRLSYLTLLNATYIAESILRKVRVPKFQL